MTERLLDAAEVAAMLGVPKTWVLAQARADAIPHVRLGRYVRFRRDAVLAWVEENEHAGRRHRPRVAS